MPLHHVVIKPKMTAHWRTVKRVTCWW